MKLLVHESGLFKVLDNCTCLCGVMVTPVNNIIRTSWARNPGFEIHKMSEFLFRLIHWIWWGILKNLIVDQTLSVSFAKGCHCCDSTCTHILWPRKGYCSGLKVVFDRIFLGIFFPHKSKKITLCEVRLNQTLEKCEKLKILVWL